MDTKSSRTAVIPWAEFSGFPRWRDPIKVNRWRDKEIAKFGWKRLGTGYLQHEYFTVLWNYLE
jgi:hypothetical protein